MNKSALSPEMYLTNSIFRAIISVLQEKGGSSNGESEKEESFERQRFRGHRARPKKAHQKTARGRAPLPAAGRRKP